MVEYTLYEVVFFLFLYAFLGWAVEVCFYSIRDRHFVNRGLVSLPFHLPCGITFALLIQLLPTLGRNFVLQFIAIFAVMTVVQSLAGVFGRRISRIARWETEAEFSGSGRDWLERSVRAVAILLVYQIVHPVLLTMMTLLPPLLIRIAVWVDLALMLVDFSVMVYAIRFGKRPASFQTTIAEGSEKWTQHLANQISAHIWRRLEKAYPGIEAEAQGSERPVFARGLCLDKLVWVFLICALLGDIIETFYCGLVNGQWMNRSSVLYGPFSFVWGIGAVVLTITLHRLAEKSDRYVFVGGFVIGGAYEYLCSVFTEIVFGTVFWDYSDMPLNIGGRTNVLFCFFWGLLAVVWVKILYPRMERAIEKTPPLAGKIATWIVIFLMTCNGLLTAGAMLRYGSRAVSPEPNGIVEEFLDNMYDDAYVEHRWPNMIVTEK